jgi:hypothetical protein
MREPIKVGDLVELSALNDPEIRNHLSGWWDGCRGLVTECIGSYIWVRLLHNQKAMNVRRDAVDVIARAEHA